MERYLPLVTSLMRRYRVTGADADDVNQTVWLRLVEHLDRIDDAPGPARMAVDGHPPRVLPDPARAGPLGADGPAGHRRPSNDPTTPPTCSRSCSSAERHTALVDALLELPAQRRDLLLLLTEDPPLTYAEISDRSGIPVGSIGPTRARALQQLRRTRAFRRLTSPDTDGSTDDRHRPSDPRTRPSSTSSPRR